MGILDSFKGDGEVVVEKQLAVKRDDGLEKKVDAIMQRYELWLTRSKAPFGCVRDYKDASKELQDTTMNQPVIDEFCVRIKEHQDAGAFRWSGLFLSLLSQNAYDHGYNDLRIDTRHQEKKICYIGTYLCGKSDNPIKVTIDGDTGGWCGREARYAHLTFNENAGEWCGQSANHSTFTFNGNAGEWCGDSANHSSFTFNGEAGYACGRNAKQSRFHSPNKETLKKIKSGAKPSCRYYLINSDGTSEEVLK